MVKHEHAEDVSEESEEEETSEEEESEEEEDVVPRLKPVFVRKLVQNFFFDNKVFRRDRVTLIEAEEEQKRLEQLHLEEEKRKEERKRESVKVKYFSSF